MPRSPGMSKCIYDDKYEIIIHDNDGHFMSRVSNEHVLSKKFCMSDKHAMSFMSDQYAMPFMPDKCAMPTMPDEWTVSDVSFMSSQCAMPTMPDVSTMPDECAGLSAD